MSQSFTYHSATPPQASSAHAVGSVSPGQATDQPLTPEHHTQLALAQQRRKKINRAVKVASFNAWSFAVFAGVSLLFAIFSVTSLVAGFLLAGLAYNEFRGRRQLSQLIRLGPRTLGINQVVCCLLIALYCGFKIYSEMTGAGVYAQSIAASPEIASMLEPIEGLIQTITIATYALILIVGVAAQGLTAWYYFSRKRHLDDYLQQTPAWVLDLDRVKSGAAA